MEQLQEQFQKFRNLYDSTKVFVYDDFMVYSTPVGMSTIFASTANKLITELGLNIRAVANESWPFDTFIVEQVK